MKIKDPLNRKITKKATQTLKASKTLFTNKKLLENTKSMPSLFSEIPPDLITNKILKTSNFLFNLYEGTLKEFDAYIIDFKCFRFNKEHLNIILTEVKNTPINISDKFLIKIGYTYDKEREMLSVLYYKGKAIPFDMELIYDKKQSDAIDEDRIKLCLISNFLALYKDPKQLMANNIFHPSLLFFLDKQGLMFFDNIFGIIFTHCRVCVSPICLPYFGLFENIREQNKQVYVLICLIIYVFANDFCEGNSKKLITYDEIVYRVKLDLANQKKDFESVFKKVTKEKLNKLKAMLTYTDLNLESALSSLFKSFKIFYEHVIEPACCDSCKITSQQIESALFTIHYPCYNIFCNKCLPSHDCKLSILKELEAKEHQLLEEKAISVLLSKKEKMPYSKEYEKIVSNFYGEFYSSLFMKIKKELLNEKVVDYIFFIILNEQKDSFRVLKNEYKEVVQNPTFSYSQPEVQELRQLLRKMEQRIEIVSEFNQIFITHGFEQFKQMAVIKKEFTEICSMLKKDIFMQLDELLGILYCKCKTFLVRYSFDTLIEEFDFRSTYQRLSIYIKKTNTVHSYDFTDNQKVQFACPYTIPANCACLNLKSMFMITGGYRSKATYALTYNEELDNSSFCQLADLTLFHMFHSMIKVGFSYVYCISGSTTSKNESYNLFTNEWKPLAAELPKPFANSSLFLYNQVDLYIFFGIVKENNVLQPSFDILKLELFVENAQWAKVSFIPPETYSPACSCGIVLLDETNILLIGGQRMNKNNETALSSDIYKFNLTNSSLKREEQRIGEEKGLSFSEGTFYEISNDKVATWGNNQKLIKFKRFIAN